MQTVSIWKPGMESLFKADANLVANEIMSIGDSVTPAQIVEKARDEGTELHKCFDWDDTSAAEKYRICQARQVVRCLVIKRPDGQENKPPVRTLYKIDRSHESGYRATELIVRNQNAYDSLLQQAYGELHAFKVKYAMLTELEEIMALIP